MNKQKGFLDGFDICLIIIIASVCFLLGIVVGGAGTENETAKPINDAEILKSRRYVVDFDKRMEVANIQISKCTNGSNDIGILNACTSTAYNAQGWRTLEYGTGTLLKESVIKEYDSHKKNALSVMSVEIK